MKLADWLRIPNADGSRKRRYKFAQAIGVTPTMVTEYAEGRIWPGKDKMEAIRRETRGAVTANDFLEAAE
jgi:3,4-dihydroxy 2-butanone 4-phosphate synthase/GTP cyclohydrolase II